MRSALLALTLICAAPPFLAAQLSDQKFASLGDFQLENGVVMRDARIGYRVAGELNADRSNAMLVPTWFAGRSGDYGSLVGPAKMLDSSRYYVIVADAFGNGVSSSPSNSTQTPFPEFTMRDNVRAQHHLVFKTLGLARLHSVTGSSMGGMQALQWAVSYPEAMRNVVAVTATTKQTSHDILLWQAELDLLESFRDSLDDQKKAMRTIAAMNALTMRTPHWIAQNVPDAKALLETHRKGMESRDPRDYISQLRAILGHDIFREFGGSIDAAARAVKARLLIVVALQDHMVNPAPAREFAKRTSADFVTLSGDCGHLASGCELDVVTREVHRFLRSGH